MKEYKTLQPNKNIIIIQKYPAIPPKYNSIATLKKVKDFQMKGQTLNIATNWSPDSRMNRVFF
jgi:hypothetical protein